MEFPNGNVFRRFGEFEDVFFIVLNILRDYPGVLSKFRRNFSKIPIEKLNAHCQIDHIFLILCVGNIILDRQIWFENGYHWDCGVLRAVYHASEDCTFIVEDRVGTFHALGMDKVELFAPGSSHNVQLSPDQDADREVNATFGEALLLFLIIPPGEYHLCKIKSRFL